MAKFQMEPTISNDLSAFTARLGEEVVAGSVQANQFTQKDVGKLVKLVGDSRYDLAAAGDKVEGIVVALGTGTADGYVLGSVVSTGRIEVTFGNTCAIGDYVEVGAVIALGTQLTTNPAVTKAGDQAVAENGSFAWRVVSLGTGNGAVGTEGLIERVAG
jgi:hypothetical protein